MKRWRFDAEARLEHIGQRVWPGRLRAGHTIVLCELAAKALIGNRHRHIVGA